MLYVIFTREHSLRTDAARLSAFAAYIIRAAFWAVLTIGIVDLAFSHILAPCGKSVRTIDW